MTTTQPLLPNTVIDWMAHVFITQERPQLVQIQNNGAGAALLKLPHWHRKFPAVTAHAPLAEQAAVLAATWQSLMLQASNASSNALLTSLALRVQDLHTLYDALNLIPEFDAARRAVGALKSAGNKLRQWQVFVRYFDHEASLIPALTQKTRELKQALGGGAAASSSVRTATTTAAATNSTSAQPQQQKALHHHQQQQQPYPPPPTQQPAAAAPMPATGPFGAPTASTGPYGPPTTAVGGGFAAPMHTGWGYPSNVPYDTAFPFHHHHPAMGAFAPYPPTAATYPPTAQTAPTPFGAAAAASFPSSFEQLPNGTVSGAATTNDNGNRQLNPNLLQQARERQQQALDQSIATAKVAAASSFPPTTQQQQQNNTSSERSFRSSPRTTLHSFFQPAPSSSRKRKSAGTATINNISGSSVIMVVPPPSSALTSPATTNTNGSSAKKPRTMAGLVAVKQEKNGEEELLRRFASVAQDEQESRLLSELKQMGFTETDEEILYVIRQCVSETQAEIGNGAITVMVTSDVVMMKLVAQREAMDEARKEDKARMESERREHSKLLRETAKQNELQQIYDASWDEFQSAHFPKSYLLRHSDLADKLRDVPRHDLVPLLQKEAEAQKFNKGDMSKPYFDSVVRPRLMGSNENDLAEMVRTETAVLQKAMYSMSEQSKLGVPRLFLEAYDAAQANGDIVAVAADAAGKNSSAAAAAAASSTASAVTPETPASKDDDDDDDVVVVMTSPSPTRNKNATKNTPSTNGTAASSTTKLDTTKPPVVIDLLD